MGVCKVHFVLTCTKFNLYLHVQSSLCIYIYKVHFVLTCTKFTLYLPVQSSLCTYLYKVHFVLTCTKFTLYLPVLCCTKYEIKKDVNCLSLNDKLKMLIQSYQSEWLIFHKLEITNGWNIFINRFMLITYAM